MTLSNTNYIIVACALTTVCEIKIMTSGIRPCFLLMLLISHTLHYEVKSVKHMHGLKQTGFYCFICNFVPRQLSISRYIVYNGYYNLSTMTLCKLMYSYIITRETIGQSVGVSAFSCATTDLQSS